MSEVLKLHKPILIDGEEKKEIPYDLDNMPSNSIQTAMKDLARIQHVVAVQESDPIYHLALFSHAAGIDFNDALRMHPKDQTKAGLVMRNFFFIDLEDGSEQISSEQ